MAFINTQPGSTIHAEVSAVDCFHAVLSSARSSGGGSAEVGLNTLHELGWQRICDELSVRCVTDDGRELSAALGILPFGPIPVRRRDEVRELSRWLDAEEPLPLRGTHAVTAALGRARKEAVLKGSELFAIAGSIHAAERTATFFRTHRSSLPRLAEHASRLTSARPLANEIQRCIESTGEVADDASPELARLRRRISSLRDQIQSRLERILRSPRYEGILQDEYVTIRDERYVVPVRAGERGDFPGIVHGSSSSGATLFIEPDELVALNNEFRVAQLETAAEVNRILSALSRKVGVVAPELEDNQDILTYLDITQAAAKLAHDVRLEYPELVDATQGAMRLVDTRHPILAMRAHAGELTLVSNDVRLPDSATCLVISGPNTGGKTVTLKTVGLFALMCRAGLPVPAGADSRMPLFRNIFSDIGDEQNVERDLSTFSAHVRNIARFLPHCGRDTLVLLDELFAGTDPEQGAALGRALLVELVGRGAWSVVTTHLESLKTLAFEDPRFACASVGFDVDRLEPTYALRMGVPGASHALRIAARLGLSPLVVESAQHFLGQDRSEDRERMLEQMEREMAAIAEERRELRTLRAQAAAAAKEAEQRRGQARSRMDEELRAEQRELRDELDRLRRAIRDEMSKLRTAGASEPEAIQSARRSSQQIEKAEREAAQQVRTVIQRSVDTAVDGQGHRALPETIQAGDPVYVVPFRKNGVVTQTPGKGDRVSVQVGPIRATFTRDDLRSVNPGPTDTAPTQEVRFTRMPDVGDAASTLDVRGTLVDDAIEQVHTFLDRAGRARLYQVTIIHGHGTGALKRAIRGFLGTAKADWYYRPGERTEGGDGVTMVYLEGPPSGPDNGETPPQ